MDLTASSAVNRPITRASLRLVVVWMGVRSIRWTYSGARVPLRFTFTRNLVFFMVFSSRCQDAKYGSNNIAPRRESLIRWQCHNAITLQGHIQQKIFRWANWFRKAERMKEDIFPSAIILGWFSAVVNL